MRETPTKNKIHSVVQTIVQIIRDTYHFLAIWKKSKIRPDTFVRVKIVLVNIRNRHMRFF
jgi:hypothetical protein